MLTDDEVNSLREFKEEVTRITNSLERIANDQEFWENTEFYWRKIQTEKEEELRRMQKLFSEKGLRS